MDDDEKEALMSIYSLPGEIEIIDNTVTINLSINLRKTASAKASMVALPVRVMMSVQKDYPDSLPDISIISEHLSRLKTTAIKTKVIERSHDLMGFPMLLALLSNIEECVQQELESDANDCETVSTHSKFEPSDVTLWTSVLHIDHMRAQNKYCKTLEKWSAELNLKGRIYFCHRLILVLLQGCNDRIKDFVVRLKTTSIDIDSKGHSCKERMMKPLCAEKVPVDEHQRYKDFRRCELTNEKDLKKVFADAGLSDMFDRFVVPNIKGYL